MADCNMCQGKGLCPRCSGSGKTDALFFPKPCPACSGQKLCLACKGTGKRKR